MRQAGEPESDGIDPLYISDIETYDLLYINEPGRELFGVSSDEDITNFKCYEFLQHRDSPCPFCTNRFLSREECYVWEYTNPITGRRHPLNDRLIDWNGRDARIEVGFEITARKGGCAFATCTTANRSSSIA